MSRCDRELTCCLQRALILSASRAVRSAAEPLLEACLAVESSELLVLTDASFARLRAATALDVALRPLAPRIQDAVLRCNEKNEVLNAVSVTEMPFDARRCMKIDENWQKPYISRLA